MISEVERRGNEEMEKKRRNRERRNGERGRVMLRGGTFALIFLMLHQKAIPCSLFFFMNSILSSWYHLSLSLYDMFKLYHLLSISLQRNHSFLFPLSFGKTFSRLFRESFFSNLPFFGHSLDLTLFT